MWNGPFLCNRWLLIIMLFLFIVSAPAFSLITSRMTRHSVLPAWQMNTLWSSTMKLENKLRLFGSSSSRKSIMSSNSNMNNYRTRMPLSLFLAPGDKKQAPPKSSSPTVTKEKQKNKLDEQLDIRNEIETDWRLMLHDDDFHYFEEVADILTQCVPLLTGQRAYDITCQVHAHETATVAVSNKKIIEEYMKALQVAGLTVSMMPDGTFEDGTASEEGEGEAQGSGVGAGPTNNNRDGGGGGGPSSR